MERILAIIRCSAGIGLVLRGSGRVQIDENEPAYKHVIVRPILSKKLSRAHYSNLTPYGRVASTVSFDGTSGKLEVTVLVAAARRSMYRSRRTDRTVWKKLIKELICLLYNKNRT